MKVRAARPDEVDVVLDMLASASAWLRARGIEQWPEGFAREWVFPAIERGETWLAEREGKIVGSLVVQWEDPIVWPEHPADAGYLHRLVAARHGLGLGEQLLKWAEAHAAENGKPYLRLDCVAWNQALRAYYERAGYEHLDDVMVGPYNTARYEKRLGG